MTDPLLRRFVDREQARTAPADQPAPPPGQSAASRILTLANEADEMEDFGAFGWLRGARERAIMLELRKRDGNIVAIGYGWLERAEFDPSVGITLLVPGQRIVIRGRNLNAEVRPNVRLFEGITRQRVSWVREAGQWPADALDSAHVRVNGIES